jgi:hypothetical protein
MELEKLQEKGIEKSFLEILKIDFLDIMPENDVISRRNNLQNLHIKDMKYEFSVDAINFISTIAEFYKLATIETKKELEYFKIHFIQDENGTFSIGFSLSSKNDSNEKNDSFYRIIYIEQTESTEKLGTLKKIDNREEFEKSTSLYETNLLPEIKTRTRTEKNTQLIFYKIKDIYLFFINHFLLNHDLGYSKLVFEIIKFEKTPKDPNNKDKLGLVVRAENSSKDKSESYDFGTVYP